MSRVEESTVLAVSFDGDAAPAVLSLMRSDVENVRLPS